MRLAPSGHRFGNGRAMAREVWSMLRRHRRAVGLLGIAAAFVLVSAALIVWRPWPDSTSTGQPPPPSPSEASTATRATTSAAASEPGSVLIGAGDICRTSGIANARKTAALVTASSTARVFTLGDNSNEEGTAGQYAGCYDPTWGAFKTRTRPAPGNHDQLTRHGTPYYAYFGAAAGTAGKGYYSYDLPANWHVIVLNSICGEVGGCGARSPQERWLEEDLAANAGKHILAMWHIPEFSSGGHGNTTSYRAWWNDLYAAQADIVLNGHDHDYERFAQQSPTGDADPMGIREFVVGTGGASHSPFLTIRDNSQVRNSRTFGVLELTLSLHSYGWQFVPIEGSAFTDSGETATHS
jgi:hypothetical protein